MVITGDNMVDIGSWLATTDASGVPNRAPATVTAKNAPADDRPVSGEPLPPV
jgi:hypothetical protein